MLSEKNIKIILNFKPFYRKLVLFIIDLLLINLSFHSTSFFFGHSLIINFEKHIYFILLLTFLAVPIYKYSGQYKSLARYISNYSIYRMIARNTFLVILATSLSSIFNITIPPYREILFLYLILNVFLIFMRIVLCDILSKVLNKKIENNYKRIAIYGTGERSVQLLNILKNHNQYKIRFFIDDDPSLDGRFINKYPIYNSKILKKFSNSLDLILFPTLNGSEAKSKKILNKLQMGNIPIAKIPSIDQITNGLVKIESLKPIQIEDYLGREPVSPNKELLNSAINGLRICIIGAGGSIGGELARQVLKIGPSKLILIERSEPSLFKINYELINLNISKIEIKSILGSAKDYKLMQKIFLEEKIDVVFHAAAYKHVSLVENNPIQGISNNVLSTNQICKACCNSYVKKMILISKDKAFRPKNIMGASKRLYEILVKAYSKLNLENQNIYKNTNTIFSIVRFGNVLNSSGSVLPLFRKQIESGGPITLTHELVERYFMTIPEAAQLVIQASSLSKGGEVFLHMGESKRIKELAEKMIISSGLEIKSKDNPDGDIEIIKIGLRPGEKLYEELLIDGTSTETKHPLIYKANEKFINPNDLFKEVEKLEKSLKNMEKNNVLSIIENLIPEWSNNTNYHS